MKLNKFTVSFEEQDMNFLKEFGIFKSSSIVRKHYKKHKTPFIYDTYQLARTIAVPRNMLFELARCAQKHYKLIMLRKKNGGLRYIHSPDKDLKHAQVQILKKVLNNIEVSQYATAYIKGKKLKDNASPHINHKYLLKMDITDFFGSITYLQVISSAFNSNMYANGEMVNPKNSSDLFNVAKEDFSNIVENVSSSDSFKETVKTLYKIYKDRQEESENLNEAKAYAPYFFVIHRLSDLRQSPRQ